jgi:hypothetical protein
MNQKKIPADVLKIRNQIDLLKTGVLGHFHCQKLLLYKTVRSIQTCINIETKAFCGNFSLRTPYILFHTWWSPIHNLSYLFYNKKKPINQYLTAWLPLKNISYICYSNKRAFKECLLCQYHLSEISQQIKIFYSPWKENVLTKLNNLSVWFYKEKYAVKIRSFDLKRSVSVCTSSSRKRKQLARKDFRYLFRDISFCRPYHEITISTDVISG